MVMRLSELLERIRPAGTPGAPTEGESQRQLAAAEEIADIVRVLHRFEAEADGVVAATQETADRLREDAERRAQRVRADLHDRIAVASALGARPETQRSDSESAGITDATAREIDRLRAEGTAHIEHLVDVALAAIWRTLPSQAPPARSS